MHPVVWLVAWLSLAIVLRGASLPWMSGVAAMTSALAWWRAGEPCRRLFYRARWLFFVIGGVMLMTTPGEFLPGWLGKAGLTWEGAALAAEHMAYLAAMLSTLSLIHVRLGNEGVIAGLYRLAWPFPWRDRLAVRLMLVLTAAEGKEKRPWREWLDARAAPLGALPSVKITISPLSTRDVVFLLAILAMLIGWGLVR